MPAIQRSESHHAPIRPEPVHVATVEGNRRGRNMEVGGPKGGVDMRGVSFASEASGNFLELGWHPAHLDGAHCHRHVHPDFLCQRGVLVLAQLFKYLLQSAGTTQRFRHGLGGLREAGRAQTIVFFIVQACHASGRRR